VKYRLQCHARRNGTDSYLVCVKPTVDELFHLMFQLDEDEWDSIGIDEIPEEAAPSPRLLAFGWMGPRRRDTPC
jgi:hypothetical protein